MKTTTQHDLKEFFTINWFRSTLLSELGLESDEPLNSIEMSKNGSFNELRIKVAQKWFGEECIGSNEFKKAEIQHNIDVIKNCISRDQTNYDSQTVLQKRKSSIPFSIERQKEKLKKYFDELKAM